MTNTTAPDTETRVEIIARHTISEHAKHQTWAEMQTAWPCIVQNARELEAKLRETTRVAAPPLPYDQREVALTGAQRDAIENAVRVLLFRFALPMGDTTGNDRRLGEAILQFDTAFRRPGVTRPDGGGNG